MISLHWLEIERPHHDMNCFTWSVGGQWTSYRDSLTDTGVFWDMMRLRKVTTGCQKSRADSFSETPGWVNSEWTAIFSDVQKHIFTCSTAVNGDTWHSQDGVPHPTILSSILKKWQTSTILQIKECLFPITELKYVSFIHSRLFVNVFS